MKYGDISIDWAIGTTAKLHIIGGMLSEQTLRELRAELGVLRRRVGAIESILEGVSTMAPARASRRQNTAEKGSFADDVRAALRSIGRTATSREVADWLENHGGPQRTQRPLRSAVSVELFRMAKKGTGGVEKVARGRYRIDPE